MDIDEEEEDTKYCTNCKHHIKTNIYEMHTLHCHRKIKLCPVCHEPVPKEQMNQHHEDNHTETPCDMCGRSVLKDQLEDHQTNECLERKMECKYCQLEVKAVDFMEHTAACGSRTDVCDKCLTRLMLRDMDDHKCGEPPPVHCNQYLTPPKPRPVGTRRAVRVDVNEIEQVQTVEPERKEETGTDDVKDQLRRDEEMAAELQAQYTNEVPHHHVGSPHPLSPNPHIIQNTHYSPTTSPRDRLLPTEDNLLTEQLQFEMRTGTRGQPTMVLYKYAVDEEEKKRNGDSPGNPNVSNGEEREKEEEEEEEEEERKREQLRRDEEMARQLQLQEEQEEETQRLLARFGQGVTHQNSPSPPLLNTEGGDERRESEQEQGVVIPCEMCDQVVPFGDYQKHIDEKHRHFVQYVQNIAQPPPPPPQRYSSPEHILHEETTSPSPTNNSQKTKNGDVGCSYCHFKYSPDVIAYHETICDMNPDKGLSRHQLQPSKVNGTSIPGESPLPPVRQVEDLTRSTDDSDEDDEIPCQFCEHLFPFSEIERHQKACPTRFNMRFLERDRGSTRSYDIFGSNISNEHKARTAFNSSRTTTSATKKTSFTSSNNGGASASTSVTSTTQRMNLVSDRSKRPTLENKILVESKYNRSSYTSGAVGGGGGRERETRENGRGRAGTRGGTRGGMRGGMRGGTRGGGGRGREASGGGGTSFIDLTAGDNANRRHDEGYGLFIEGATDHKDEDDEMEVDSSFTERDGSNRGYQGESFTKRRK